MAECGIVRIDALLGGQGQALAANDADKQAVGAVQDLLICHGAAGLPGLLASTHGQFGPLTSQRVRQFQGATQLPQTGMVDRPTLRKLIDLPAALPRVSQAYVALVLDFALGGVRRAS